MQKQFLCENTDHPLVLKFSKALRDAGIIEDSKYYYMDEGYDTPYFKIAKPYLKENPTDPDFHYVYVDIDNTPRGFYNEEYTVFGTYTHEHIPNVEATIELVKKLLSGEVVEIGVVYPDRMAVAFAKNTGDHLQNVKIIGDNMQTVYDHLTSNMVERTEGHIHVIFSPTAPYSIRAGRSTEFTINGVQLYFFSSILAVHPEIYIVR